MFNAGCFLVPVESATSSRIFATACIGSHETTPVAEGRAPSAKLDLTKMGTQSVVAHAPFGKPPET